MLRFIKKIFITAMTFVDSVACVLMSNQEYKVRPIMVTINNNEHSFYPYNVLVNKISDSCNDVNNRTLNNVLPILLKT